MKTVRPTPLGTPVSDLPLTPEEGFVLSRIDGNLSVKDLVALTGIDEARVEEIVTKLAAHGAIALDAEGEDDTSTTSLADLAAAVGMDPDAFAATDEIPTLDPDVHGVFDEPVETADAAEEPMPAPEPEPETEPAEAVVEDTDDAEATRNYRQLYQEKFHTMTTDARVQAAHAAQGSDLFALCLDPEPRVIAALVENPTAGLDHVRMIALHHRTGTGLEIVSRRQEWLRDAQVERRLLRNPQTPESVLARIMGSKPLLATYKIMVDREVPEMTRTRTRGHFRKKWATASPEDRADLVLRTEGRPLMYMTGCTFDARTTQIVCGKTIASMLLIQNFAKFPATPPSILAHCMKQAFVRKNPGMRKLLLQHPNMPGEVKRSV